MKTISEAEKNFRGIPSFPEASIHNRVIKAVLQGFKKPDWATSRAIEEFVEHYRNSTVEKPEKELIKEVRARESIEAVIALHGAAIELSALIKRLEHAEKKWCMALDNVTLTVEEFEGIDSEIDWGVDSLRLWIVKEEKEKEEAAFRKSVEFVRAMASGSVPTLVESVRMGVLPEEIKEVIRQMSGTKMKEFLADIAELMIENGEAGKQAVLKICEDVEAAKERIMDPDSSGPLKFLAGIVMKFVMKPS